jgi:MFS family permease
MEETTSLALTDKRLCLGLLLSVLESTITSTALISITDALNGSHKSGWVVTAYLLTYSGCLTWEATIELR